MVFFQAALLAGYAYAHASTALLAPARQVLLHLAVLAPPLAVLPLAVNPRLLRGGEANPVLDVLTLLSLSVGLPFLVVSATAPLLQQWFTRTGIPPRAIPTSSTRRAISAACSPSRATRPWSSRACRCRGRPGSPRPRCGAWARRLRAPAAARRRRRRSWRHGGELGAPGPAPVGSGRARVRPALDRGALGAGAGRRDLDRRLPQRALGLQVAKRRRRRRISRAAFRPGEPMTPPPGCAAAPQR